MTPSCLYCNLLAACSKTDIEKIKEGYVCEDFVEAHISITHARESIVKIFGDSGFSSLLDKALEK